MIDTAQVQRILRLAATVDVSEAVVAAQSLLDDLSTPLYTDEKRDLIGAWLAAHFFSPDAVVRTKVGEAETQYAPPVNGAGLNTSRYGRMVLTLDTSRYFAGLGKRRMMIEALGPVDRDASATETE